MIRASSATSQHFDAELTDEQLASAELRSRREPWTVVAAVVVLILALQISWSLINNPRFGWRVIAAYLFAPQVLGGLLTTILLTVCAMAVATLFGVILALSLRSRNPVLVVLAKFFVWFFRAIPLLVQLIFWYNLAALYPRLALALPFGPSFFEVDTNKVITSLGAALIALSLNEGAYMAEIVRSGLSSVDHGQHEAARALGMSSWHTFSRITLPQAMRVIIPPTGNEAISMLKYSSVVSVIALPELLYSTQLISSQNFEVIPMLMVASVWYLVVTTLLMAVQSRIERRFSRSVVRK
ncbi:ABC-type amino acid transport system, permease component [Paraburkholderia caribensis MBA4]|uniref:Glutamate/aspartate import permease protein GltK n=1 Tax=Paraburkholderia caribensis MBA4 TaxID=1323664 RepID=A0A0N7JV55_9BURK|nr:amino acid ABC transporter permease [Paraburkholderia caribensis]ALL68269.1 ABC-type amino acid transport system, permease component [Paraburkholderia caribensis MBA4]